MIKFLSSYFYKIANELKLSSKVGKTNFYYLNIESTNKMRVVKLSLIILLAGLFNLNISAQINPGTAFDLNKHINDRINAGETYIVVAPGRYRVPKYSNTHLYFHNRDNITIVADGVEMICTSTVQAVTMYQCDNFKIQGLTVDYDPLPFTQGTIVGISADKLTLTVDLISGYPSTNINGHCEIYDPNTGELVTTSYYGVTYNVNQSTRRVIITKPSNYLASNSFEELGDIVVMQSNDGSNIPHAFVLDQCTNLTLENTIVYSGTSMGYLETKGSANKYINCKVARRPLATEVVSRGVKRMRTTNIDGFHSKFAGVGPSYVGCEVEYNGDDGFAINGDFEVVLATSGNVMQVVGKAGQIPDLAIGETIEIISYTGERLADATITGFAIGRAVTAAEKTFLQSQTYYAEASQTYTATNVYDVTINRTITLPMGSVVNSANKIGNGFEIRNCKVKGNRARGATIKAGNGIITGCTFTDNWAQAINMSPEFTWLEGGSNSNVVVSNNIITGCHDAAVAVFSKGGNGSISPAGAHNNIQITANTISGSTNPAIAVTSTTNLTLNTNTISSPNNALLVPWVMNEFGRTEDPNRQIYLLNTTSAVPSYTISYNGNGNTGGTVPANQTKTQGTDITLANNSGNLVKTGSTFTGWNTQADGLGTNYAAGATYSIDAALSLYAKWTVATTYTISYNGNGNTGGTAPANQTKTQGESITLATNSGSLVRTGYTFSGWNTLANGTGTNYAVGATYSTDATLILYAKWTPLTYNVTYSGNGSTGGSAPASQTKTYGVSLTLATNSGNLVRTGYVFGGWNTSSKGTGTNYAAGATYTANAALTLYAKWTPTYKVTYNGNGNTGGTVPASQTKINGVNLTLAYNTGNLVRTGFVFAGWNTSSRGTGTNYAEGATYTGNAALTLYAKWTQSTGAKVAIEKIKDETVESLSTTLIIYPNPVKNGYLNVKLEGNDGVSKIEMYDITGRLTYSKRGFNQSKLTIDVSNFESGIYFLKVQTDGLIQSKKVVIE